MLESIRLGKRAKNQLVSLKRKTGISNWNILCRWAFVLSIAEPSRPRRVTESLDEGVEMTWRTFGGEYTEIYEALLTKRCIDDGVPLSPTDMSQQFRFHVYRGIGYLAAGKRISNIGDLATLSTSNNLHATASI